MEFTYYLFAFYLLIIKQFYISPPEFTYPLSLKESKLVLFSVYFLEDRIEFLTSSVIFIMMQLSVDNDRNFLKMAVRFHSPGSIHVQELKTITRKFIGLLHCNPSCSTYSQIFEAITEIDGH